MAAGLSLARPELVVIVVRAGRDGRVLGFGGLLVAVRPVLNGTVPVGMAVHRDAFCDDLVEPGLDPAQATAHARSWDRLVAIAVALPGGQCQRLRYGELGQFLFGERPGLLDELAVRQLPDDAHLDAVLEQ